MGGEIEGDGEPHLARREILAIEGVGFLRRREARILADGPGPVRIHRGPRAAQVRRESGEAVEVFDAFEIGGGIEGFDRNSLGRGPGERIGRPARELARRQPFPVGQGLLVEAAHAFRRSLMLAEV